MDAKRIGKTLRALRGEKSASDVAKALAISKSALAMYERGERVPRDEVKIRISSYYGQSVQAIFFTQ